MLLLFRATRCARVGRVPEFAATKFGKVAGLWTLVPSVLPPTAGTKACRRRPRAMSITVGGETREGRDGKWLLFKFFNGTGYRCGSIVWTQVSLDSGLWVKQRAETHKLSLELDRHFPLAGVLIRWIHFGW